VARRGAVPMITWEPFDPGAGLDQPEYRLASLCSLPGSETGSAHDAYIDDWAVRLAAYGQPVLLRFAHEMNGTWYPWAEQANGNQAGDYVAAWNCVRARFAVAGASNVGWVWSPNVDYSGATPLSQVFPGDGAVTWVALDGYNWGTTRPDQGWKTFAQIFGWSILQVDLLSNRPMMIAETASTEQGGNKAAWIQDAMLRQIPMNYPQVRALVWFNENKETDWRITSSPVAKQAFASAVNHGYWKASLATAQRGWP
jgi:beta-mannanase